MIRSGSAHIERIQSGRIGSGVVPAGLCAPLFSVKAPPPDQPTFNSPGYAL
jgi:hypothetical protein